MVEFSYALHILSTGRNKIHVEILHPGFQTSGNFLQGPGGVWCDVDMVEILYFSALDPVPKEQHYTEIVDDSRGGDPCIGSGSQVFLCSYLIFPMERLIWFTKNIV